jgi:AcrR family transcriptional regulator
VSDTEEKRDSLGLTPPEEGSKPQERILHAALELFVKKGYFNTNVPDISKLSRCSVGSIYHHFLNKEEIAKRLYLEGIEQFRQALGEVIDPESGIEQNIREIVIQFLLFAEAHHTLSNYLWLQRHDEFLSGNVERPTIIRFDSFGKKLARTVKSGVRSGKIPNIETFGA